MKTRKPKMRHLIDKWTPLVFILFCMIKALQTLKSWGFTPKNTGWRSAMNAFFRTEHSKFTLAVFHLNIFSDEPKGATQSFQSASDHLIRRLYEFWKARPESHWQLVWKKFHVARVFKKNIDIVKANFSVEGHLLSIEPHLDPQSSTVETVSPTIRAQIDQKIIDFYNETKDLADYKRPWELRVRILKWLHAEYKTGLWKVFISAVHYMERILSAIFIHFDYLPGSTLRDRFTDPPFNRLKHPGHGLLNVHARFTPDFKESDLWFQFHHVAVDGVPMQEILNSLKESWGTCTQFRLPSAKGEPVIISELGSSGRDNTPIYQAKQFIDFRPFLAVRKKLNAEHTGEINASITAVGMLLWGLAHHPLLHDRKFMFTVEMPETEVRELERSPGLVIIRPSRYFDPQDPRRAFLRFQKVLDERIRLTRARKSESFELMESYALTTPFIYKLVQNLFPKSFAEFIGTVGLTMIRDSDHFTTPLSEVHTDGFLAFGNFSIPTEDGGEAGVVTARGSEKQVQGYLEAVRDVVLNFQKYC